MPNRRCRGLVGHGAPTFSGALNPRCKRRGGHEPTGSDFFSPRWPSGSQSAGPAGRLGGDQATVRAAGMIRCDESVCIGHRVEAIRAGPS
jgi:hypothetical protein